MRMKNRVRATLEEGKVPIGMQCFSGSEPLVEIMGYAGFDFVMLDMEHSPLDWHNLANLVRTAEGAGMSPFVRVPDGNEGNIRRALEVGSHGIIVPQVKSADDVRAAIAAAAYPPDGIRGMCPATRASRYSIHGWDEFLRWTKEEVMIVPIIENQAALENVRDICSIPEIEVINFGPGDLGQNLGVGAGGMSTPEVQAAFKTVVAAADDTHTAVMTVPFPDLSAEACESLIANGVKVLLHTVDELLFMESCLRIVESLKGSLQLSNIAYAAKTQ